jgi:hypothetical protein
MHLKSTFRAKLSASVFYKQQSFNVTKSYLSVGIIVRLMQPECSSGNPVVSQRLIVFVS